MTKKTKTRKSKQIKIRSNAMLYLHYLNLRLQKMFGRKSFQVKSSNICTQGERISIGEEYQYKEGGYLAVVVIEDIAFKGFFLYVKLHFIELNRTITCSHTFKPSGYMGMWRIWDKDHYDIEEYRNECVPVDQAALDSIPVIYLP